MLSTKQAASAPPQLVRPDAPPASGTEQASRGLPVSEAEPFWPAQLAVAVALALYVTLPHKLVMGPRWLVPGVEGVLLAGLVVTTPTRHLGQSPRRRGLIVLLLGLVSATTLVSLLLLADFLLHGSKAGGGALIVAGGELLLTTILVFGIWFWELDRGGPGMRCHSRQPAPDFLFPQMSAPELSAGWRPRFTDYLYLSYTNAAAFSPTDTQPLTTTAKALMAAESAIALVTLLLVVSRAVNVLG
jgi:hypothetical protein